MKGRVVSGCCYAGVVGCTINVTLQRSGAKLCQPRRRQLKVTCPGSLVEVQLRCNDVKRHLHARLGQQ